MRLLIIFFLLASSLFAHKLSLFTDYEKGTLFIDAYFANGNGCQNCEVKVKTLDGKIIKQLKTDTKGEANIDINKKKFVVIVNAWGGHIARQEVSLDDKIPNNESKTIEHSVQKSDLEKENEKLRAKVKLLEQQLQYLNFAKIIFAIFIIIGIFYVLKRVKK
ncbi:hypothetical protein [Arcobacter sp. CECT 8985]|uniref:hypothetical protein n=1 Tax=Arcobacter sp. CECT 8985 TaxID=1935424 RepID=UPI00100B0AF6|nr:hypothetical protein [Arcobacter sp. CECT 8985]RXJ87876.1 hypothetical protein CRU93_01690 [Arcobacter sp. CECT 8985]